MTCNFSVSFIVMLTTAVPQLSLCVQLLVEQLKNTAHLLISLPYTLPLGAIKGSGNVSDNVQGNKLSKIQKQYSSINGVGELTTVSRASSNFASLRTVIPMSIINQWKLKQGDKLEWEWQALKGEMVLIVKKARK